MKKRLIIFFAFLLSFLFVFGACAPTEQKKPQISDPPAVQPDDPPSEQDEEQPGLWDTSDVDISHINSERLLAFTFDDGPKAETAALLDVFERFNESNPDWQAHATLFTLGGNISETNKQTLRRAFEGGMELGNHSFSHANLTAVNDDQIRQEINSTDLLLQEIDGKERHLFRPPGGHYSDHVLSLAAAPFINWTGDLDTSDWTGVSDNEIYNKISSNLLDGGIVLMHQGYTNTIKAVERLLPDLKERGFQIVSVSELAKAYGIKMYTGQAYSYLG